MAPKFALAAVFTFGIFVAWGLTQQPAEKAPPAPPVKEKAPAEPDTLKDDQRICRESGLKGEGPDLIVYFRNKTLKQPDPKAISLLVKQLGDDDFQTREKAFTELVGMGASALTGIKEGESNPDLEVQKRIADLKKRIDTKAEPMLQAAAARVIAKLKPEGAAETLLMFLPFASDPNVVDEICKTLGAVAVRNGKVEPSVLTALEDKIAIKRAAAGEALARAKEELPRAKALLKDQDISVRFRVCMAMVALEDKEIVPVMIELLDKLSPAQLWPIEEALLRLAGDKAPNVGLGTDDATKKACRDAWTKWYAANEKTIDMTKLSAGNVYLGYTLIVQYNNRIGGVGVNQVGEVFELDKEKNVRWKFTVPGGQNTVVDAQVVGSGRVLVAEYQNARVTERDVVKGEVKWDYNCGANPFTAQRLPNGNTFIAMQGRMIEVDRNKNEVWSYQRPNSDIVRAKKLPGGEVVFIANLGGNATCFRIDPRAQNKVVQQFQMAQVAMLFGSIDVLPNGNVVVAHYNNHRVIEYDKNGGQVGNAITLNWVNSVTRLPNGNNLVTSYTQRMVKEFNPQAQQVWEHQTDGIVFVARRR